MAASQCQQTGIAVLWVYGGGRALDRVELQCYTTVLPARRGRYTWLYSNTAPPSPLTTALHHTPRSGLIGYFKHIQCKNKHRHHIRPEKNCSSLMIFSFQFFHSGHKRMQCSVDLLLAVVRPSPSINSVMAECQPANRSPGSWVSNRQQTRIRALYASK